MLSDRHDKDVVAEDYADLEVPTLLKRTLGLQRRHHGLHVGSSGRIEPILTSMCTSVDWASTPPDGRFRRVSANDLFVLYPDEGTELFEDEIDDLDAIEDLVSPHGIILVNLYFRIVHPSFPILHKKVFLEKYERTYREFSPALLAAVYLLGMNYWGYNPKTSHLETPKVDPLVRLAMKSLHYAMNRPKLSTVEAGLLLLQRSSETSWPLTAQLVAVGQDLGLHRDCSNWDIPGWERGLRKRLAWALYMQDKWASLVQGRPSHIFQSDWRVKPLFAQDFPENSADENDEEGSTEVEKGRQLFTCMVSLTQILSDILGSLYSAAADEEASQNLPEATTQSLLKAKPLQIRLKEWYSKLPSCLSIDHITVRKLSSSGYVHLAYWTVEITLHRSIARTLAACTNGELKKICQQAALARSSSAIAFVKSLKPEHWHSFWYFSSGFGFGLIGIFETLLSGSFVEDEDIKASAKRLDQYQWTLKMARKGAGFLDKSIAMVDLAAKQSTQTSSKGPHPGRVEQISELHLGNSKHTDCPCREHSEAHASLSTESDYLQDPNDHYFFGMEPTSGQLLMEDVTVFDKPLAAYPSR